MKKSYGLMVFLLFFSFILSSCGTGGTQAQSSNNMWTWMSGSNIIDQKGTYGATVGTPGGVPGARDSAVSWIDGSGNLWLFGGFGYDSAGSFDYLNDLWKFDPANSTWTWMSGSNIIDQNGTYGATVGTPGGVPGARGAAMSWIDGSGNLWLFGGIGYVSAGSLDVLNDLWVYKS
jgi:Kelch motif